MASAKILERKQQVVEEIKSKESVIDILDDDISMDIWVSILIPIVGVLVIITFSYILFYDLCFKHKNKIKQFLRIK